MHIILSNGAEETTVHDFVEKLKDAEKINKDMTANAYIERIKPFEMVMFIVDAMANVVIFRRLSRAEEFDEVVFMEI